MDDVEIAIPHFSRLRVFVTLLSGFGMLLVRAAALTGGWGAYLLSAARMALVLLTAAMLLPAMRVWAALLTGFGSLVRLVFEVVSSHCKFLSFGGLNNLSTQLERRGCSLC
jgi:hypothetical protein